MVKHTQNNLLAKANKLFPTNCLSVSDHFVGLTLKVLNGLMRNQPSLVPKVWSLTGPVLKLGVAPL